jgi:hypothetical protein
MVQRKKFNQLIIKIQQEIINTAPISVEGMPYARAWVFEEVINRIGEDDPLLCSTEKGYEKVSPWGAKAAIKGSRVVFPELERVTLDVVTKFLGDINDACPTHEDKQSLATIMSAIV